MSLFSCAKVTPENYLILIMNSKMSALYIDSFINSTSHCTTGDAKLLIIKIPTKDELNLCDILFNNAYKLKESVAKGLTTDSSIARYLKDIESQIDNSVNRIYDIND